MPPLPLSSHILNRFSAVTTDDRAAVIRFMDKLDINNKSPPLSWMRILHDSYAKEKIVL